MGLSAIDAAARARAPLDVLAFAPDTSRNIADVTRAAGMRGWEGELCRRAEGASLDQAARMLRWWPADVVREAVATGRARPGYTGFISEVRAAEREVAETVLGSFRFLEGLVADLEWLVAHCEPEGRPQLAAAVRRGFPARAAPRAHALAAALRGFRDDCVLRAWERLGVVAPLHAMVLHAAAVPRSDDPLVFGWRDDDVARARACLADRGWVDGDRVTAAGRHLRARVEAEADALAADPWETMTESRRTRALGVVQAAAEHVGALPR